MAINNKPKIKEESFITGVDVGQTKDQRKIRLSYYMTQDMYIKWERYKLAKLEAGDKVSFQSETTRFLEYTFNAI